MRPLALVLALLAAPAAAHDYEAGALAVGHPFTVVARGPVAAGYLTVTNAGAEPDALLAVETPAAPRATLHQSRVDADGMASMDRVDRFPIAPGETLTLAPGGAHVMFEGLAAPLAEGARVPATLVFERAGRMDVEFAVEPLSALAGGAADDGAMDHGAMDHGAVEAPAP